MSIEPGILYVVATPIGNLEDMSPRALRVLRAVDWVAAEDTRHSKHLLRHFGITTPLVSFHAHNEHARISRILTDLAAGKSIALISDAGTPLISDPGYQLLRGIHAQGLRAVPIPGPSSVLAALSVAGLPTDRFVFEGFLPARSAARRQRLHALREDERTLVFMEASHRVQESLDDMGAVLGGERRAVVARELTKLFEEIHGDTLAGLCEWIAADENRRKGEFVVMVHGAQRPVQAPFAAETRHLLAVLLQELPVKRAAAAAAKITGHKRNALYALAMAIKDEMETP